MNILDTNTVIFIKPADKSDPFAFSSLTSSDNSKWNIDKYIAKGWKIVSATDFDKLNAHQKKWADDWNSLIDNESNEQESTKQSIEHSWLAALPIDEKIRLQRESECFSVINRGELWYDTLSDVQKVELKLWYQEWLDAPATGIIPKKPEWLK